MRRKPPIWKRCCDTTTTTRRGFCGTTVRETMTAARATDILRVSADNLSYVTRSKINPTLSQRKCWDILWAAVVSKPADSKINPLIARNIGREYGRAWLKTQAQTHEEG